MRRAESAWRVSSLSARGAGGQVALLGYRRRGRCHGSSSGRFGPGSGIEYRASSRSVAAAVMVSTEGVATQARKLLHLPARGHPCRRIAATHGVRSGFEARRRGEHRTCGGPAVAAWASATSSTRAGTTRARTSRPSRALAALSSGGEPRRPGRRCRLAASRAIPRCDAGRSGGVRPGHHRRDDRGLRVRTDPPDG